MKNLITFLILTSLLLSCIEQDTQYNDEQATNSSTEDTPPKFEETTEIPCEKIEPPLVIQDFCFFAPDKDIRQRLGQPAFDSNGTFQENGYCYEAKICINFKDFSGHSPYNIPFVLTSYGSVSEIYVAGELVNEYKGEWGEIFFRRNIPLEGGYNRIPVKVISKSGKIRESYIEVNIEDKPEQIEIKNN